jgi:hypothetical protein
MIMHAHLASKRPHLPRDDGQPDLPGGGHAVLPGGGQRDYSV